MELGRTRGDTYADEFTIGNAKTGTAADLTGCTLVMTVSSVRNPVDNTAQVYQLTGVVEDPSSGVVYFLPSVEHVNNVGLFYFDIQMTDSNGIVRTIVKDTYTFTQDITK